ncbi:MAG TPA: hypothetical protein VJM46_01045 [Candidatus Saccharimonadales bacterium]|nr:hypothetical protein [Candidatus Saccharimonadales bacterium]
MSQPPRPRRRPQPRRIVHYKVVVDALGPYIVLKLEDVLLPQGVPAHRLPKDATLEWKKMEWRFTSGDMNISERELQQLFREFADQMGWDIRLVQQP